MEGGAAFAAHQLLPTDDPDGVAGPPVCPKDQGPSLRMAGSDDSICRVQQSMHVTGSSTHQQRYCSIVLTAERILVLPVVHAISSSGTAYPIRYFGAPAVLACAVDRISSSLAGRSLSAGIPWRRGFPWCMGEGFSVRGLANMGSRAVDRGIQWVADICSRCYIHLYIYRFNHLAKSSDRCSAGRLQCPPPPCANAHEAIEDTDDG